ncbi:MAG: IS21 family transposase [Candidatus Rokuibacteriota bacterium]
MVSQEQEMLSVAPVGATEEPLIEESVWGAVRSLRERGMSKKQIGRELGLDIKTVRKWLGQKWEPQRRPARGRALDSWESFLRGRAPEVGFNVAVLHRELAAQGFRGSYPALVRYVRPWREAQQSEESSTVRFETGPGEQSQVDWGSARVWLGEERVQVHVFTMVLGYSRRIFARGYLREGLGSLLDGHAQAFAHFGGRTETILYDNPRTIVLRKDESSGWVEWNAKFKDRMEFYGVTIRLCRYYRARTKGKVESGVKYVKRNALAGRRFRDLEELNAWLLEWCLTVADQRVHGTTHEQPAQRFARAEAAALLVVDSRPPAPQERIESRIVPRDGLVAVESNRYPVPLSWAGHTVRVHLLAEEVHLGRDGEETVRYGRLVCKHEVARWDGPPRSTPGARVAAAAGPPRFDPAYLTWAGEVEMRPLASYEEVTP